MTLQYILSGGQLHFDKKAFTGELLLPGSPMKKLLYSNSSGSNRQPKITKQEDLVTIDFNNSADIVLDENFYDLFRNLKEKHKQKLKGKVVIRITALTSYHVVLDLNSEDNKVIYE